MQDTRIELLSVRISSLPKYRLLSLFERSVADGRALSVFTPNTQMLIAANLSREIRRLLGSSSINIPDGTGVCLASRLLKKGDLCRLCGIDVGEELLSLAARRGFRVFLLGGKAGVAKEAARRLSRRYEGLRICGWHHGYFEKSQDENEKVLTQIRRARPDILFVCFGFPLQERWIANNLASLPSVRLAMGLGGSLDVWSGRLRRAPRAMRAIGLEWLWRIILEPRRAEIFLDIPLFLLLLMRYRKAQKELSRHFFT